MITFRPEGRKKDVGDGKDDLEQHEAELGSAVYTCEEMLVRPDVQRKSSLRPQPRSKANSAHCSVDA